MQYFGLMKSSIPFNESVKKYCLFHCIEYTKSSSKACTGRCNVRMHGKAHTQKINILRYEKFCTRRIEYIKRYTIQLFLFLSKTKLSSYCKLSSERVPLDRNRFLDVHNLFFALICISYCS